MSNKKEWWLKPNKQEPEPAKRSSSKLYRTSRWSKIRQLVLQMYNNHCCKCNRLVLNTDELEVHHVHHLNLSPDGERLKYSIYDDEGKPNLILLCDACHGQASSIEQREQSMIPFEELFKDPTKEFEL